MGQRHSARIAQDKSFHFAVHLVNYSRRMRIDSSDLVLTRLGEAVDSEPSTQNLPAPEVSMVTEASQYSILVVEDNQDLVIGLQNLLRHDGYAVTVAGAIELVRAHYFNAILMDLGLPDGDRLDVLKETRRLDPSLPVVIVTADISRDRTVGSLMEGAFAYLTKPYDQEELRHTLRRAVGVNELATNVERTEYLLNESEGHFPSLVESASDATVVADRRGFIWAGEIIRDLDGRALHILGTVRATECGA